MWAALPPAVPDAPSAEFDLSVGGPDTSLFPLATWRRLVSATLRPSLLAASAYEGEGDEGLRREIARSAGLSRSVVAGPADVLLTNGAQQGLDVVARRCVDVGPGARLEPGRDRIVRIERGHRCAVVVDRRLVDHVTQLRDTLLEDLDGSDHLVQILRVAVLGHVDVDRTIRFERDRATATRTEQCHRHRSERPLAGRDADVAHRRDLDPVVPGDDPSGDECRGIGLGIVETHVDRRGRMVGQPVTDALHRQAGSEQKQRRGDGTGAQDDRICLDHLAARQGEPGEPVTARVSAATSTCVRTVTFGCPLTGSR